MASNKLVFGVGRNDAGCLTAKVVKVDGRQVCIWRCQFYSVWTDMLRRCYAESHKACRPAYDGCEVDAAWHSFAEFRKWMISQPWQENHLDKDILVPGNRIYRADRCIFIPRALNNFLTDGSARRGDWPIGVSLAKSRGNFLSQCCNPFTNTTENLGYHATPSLAHAAWLKRKREHALRYASLQSDPRIAEALIRRFFADQLT